MEIKAIETIYNGYKFRSRLEARWAVFFDAVGIKYEYEPEGFTDGDLCYLPDFYLPEHDTYVEVKPKREGFLEELQKAFSFINEELKIKRLLILQDVPNPNEYASWFLYPFAFYSSLFGAVDFQWVQLCRIDGKMVFKPDLYYLKRIVTAIDLSPKEESVFNKSGFLFEQTAKKEDAEFLKMAYKKARSSRFEFGEKG